ncbi:AAC(3) family N-acetyltransferase [Actinopolymorpha sp. NPDC004070]|uniref:AAC(3) family N-acetyltransferase n=1 Tax=Actinopolymorpha sp. NPDC004070 TaxID=3154548 RepID=UPI0033BBA1AA
MSTQADGTVGANPARTVSEGDIAAGLRALGLTERSTVLVHTSLRSFGRVDGGAEAVCRALLDVCGTLLLPAGAGDRTRVPAPPGLVRPHNAYWNAASWADFDQALDRAVPYSPDLPVDRYLGRVPETMRAVFGPDRGNHPLFAFQAAGEHASTLLAAERPDRPLGPIEALADLDGDVVLLGVTHEANTTVHLAEQRLGRSRFFRYAKVAAGVWAEFANLGGESHRFDEIEPVLRPATTEVRIGSCRARRVGVRDVLAAVTEAVRADPAALLCPDPGCRCGAALAQRLAYVRR